MTEVPGFDVEEWKVAVLNPKAIHIAGRLIGLPDTFTTPALGGCCCDKSNQSCVQCRFSRGVGF